MKVTFDATGEVVIVTGGAHGIGADLDHWRDTIGIGDPEDVVGPLLFLRSDAAAMTGSQLTRERAFARLETFEEN